MTAAPQVRHPVVVVGAGIGGIACARALLSDGLPVRVLDRGRRIGGRMALWTTGDRVVDIGASYLTASDPAFAAVVDDWCARGLARPWTSAPSLLGGGGLRPGRDGPVRWAAPGGLRSLVEDLAAGIPVESAVTVRQVGPGPSVDGEPASAVVLAMPDPQARRLLPAGSPALAASAQEWRPVLALAAGWRRRHWPSLSAAFVDDPDLAFLADDGDRRGDGAPVLVAHSTPELAGRHLANPDAAAAPMLAALGRLLGPTLGPLTGSGPLPEPDWARVHRWTFAHPGAGSDQPYHLGDDLVGLCGDGWGPRPRVEAAYLSGRALGRRLAQILGGGSGTTTTGPDLTGPDLTGPAAAR
jgi:renalase